MDLIESVRHDAAALCHFIDQVANRCVLSQSPSYTEASIQFFRYIFDLGEATKRHIQNFIDDIDHTAAVNDPDSLAVDAQQIQTLRYSWFRLHRFVKPALAANTLEVPHTLVDMMTSRLRQVSSLQAVSFAVLHTSDLNYYQIKTGHFEQLASSMAAIVPNAPSYPSNLGVIAIPDSQSTSVFLNTALAHEMGHYVFDQRDEAKALLPAIATALLKHPGMATIITSSLEAQLCIDRCVGWLTEVYCDLFALYLIGPCFSFGFVELFALSRMARLSIGASSPSPIYSLLDFVNTHPSEALRLREQARFLARSSLSWWGEVDKSVSSHVSLLRDALGVPDSALRLEPEASSEVNKLALNVFLQVLPSVHESVEKVFAGVPSGVNAFVAEKESIQKYLQYGTVPSRLLSNGSVVIPSATSILNAAHFFYLDHLDGLLDRIKSAEASCLECRAMWSEKIEMWTTKALEDVSEYGNTFA